MIKWFNAKERNGMASLYSNNITLNAVAMYPIDYAFRVLVGIDDDKNIVIKPCSKNEVESGTLDESSRRLRRLALRDGETITMDLKTISNGYYITNKYDCIFSRISTNTGGLLSNW